MMDFIQENLLYVIPAGIAVLLYVAWEISNGVRSRRARRSGRPLVRPPGDRWRWFRWRRNRQAPKDEDEFHADEAARVTRRLEEQAREAQVRHEQRMAEIDRKLEKARRLVEESGVGLAAVELLATMWHWPMQARQRDWARPAGLHELEYLTLEEEPDDRLKELAWRWDGRPYRLELTGDPVQSLAGETQLGGGLSLHVEDEQVLELEVSRPASGDERLWAVTDVGALLAGDWMAEFVQFSGRLRFAEEEKRRQMEFERQSARADRIDLGQFDQEEEADAGASGKS